MTMAFGPGAIAIPRHPSVGSIARSTLATFTAAATPANGLYSLVLARTTKGAREQSAQEHNHRPDRPPLVSQLRQNYRFRHPLEARSPMPTISRDRTAIERIEGCLDTTHALALVRPQVELPVVGQRRQIGFVKGNGGPMEKDLSPNSTQGRPDGSIDLDGIGPGSGIMIAHSTPARVVVKRTPDAGRFRRVGVIVAAQPGEAVPPAHAHLDQRPAVDLPGFAARLDAHDLIARDSDPLLDNGMAGRALAGEPRKLPDLPADRHDLEIRGALTPDHADGNSVACCAPCGDLDERTGRILVEYGHGGSHRGDGFGERRNRCPAFTLRGAHELITYVARRNEMDGKR